MEAITNHIRCLVRDTFNMINMKENKNISFTLIILLGFYLVDLFFYKEQLLLSTVIVYTFNIGLLLISYFFKATVYKKIIVLESIIWMLHLVIVKEYVFSYESGLFSHSNIFLHWKAIIFDLLNLLIRSILVFKIIFELSIVKVIFLTILMWLIFFIKINHLYTW